MTTNKLVRASDVEKVIRYRLHIAEHSDSPFAHPVELVLGAVLESVSALPPAPAPADTISRAAVEAAVEKQAQACADGWAEVQLLELLDTIRSLPPEPDEEVLRLREALEEGYLLMAKVEESAIEHALYDGRPVENWCNKVRGLVGVAIERGDAWCVAHGQAKPCRHCDRSPRTTTIRRCSASTSPTGAALHTEEESK